MLVMDYAELRRALKAAEEAQARQRRLLGGGAGAAVLSTRRSSRSRKGSAAERGGDAAHGAPPSAEDDEAFRLLLEGGGSKIKKASSSASAAARVPRTSSELAGAGPSPPATSRSVHVDDTRDASKEMEAAVRAEQLARIQAALPDLRHAQPWLLAALESLLLEREAARGSSSGGAGALSPAGAGSGAGTGTGAGTPAHFFGGAEDWAAGPRRPSSTSAHVPPRRGEPEPRAGRMVSAEVQTAALVARNRYVQTDDDPELELPRLRRGPQLGAPAPGTPGGIPSFSADGDSSGGVLTEAALEKAAAGEAAVAAAGGGSKPAELPRAHSGVSVAPSAVGSLAPAKSAAKAKRGSVASALQAPGSGGDRKSSVAARRSRWSEAGGSPLERSFAEGGGGDAQRPRHARRLPPRAGRGGPRPRPAAAASLPPAWRPLLAEWRGAPSPMDRRNVLALISAIYRHREEAMEALMAMSSTAAFAHGTLSHSGLHTAPPPPPLPDVAVDALTAKFGYRHRFARGLAEFAAGVRANTAENHRVRLFARFCGMMTEWSETQGPLSCHALTVYLQVHGALRAAMARRGAVPHAPAPALELLVPAEALEEALAAALESRMGAGSLAAVVSAVRAHAPAVPGAPPGYVYAEPNIEGAVEQWQREHELPDTVLMKLLRDFDDSRTGAISAAQFLALCRHLHPGLPPDAVRPYHPPPPPPPPPAAAPRPAHEEGKGKRL
eukprot:tig00000139_g8295.t1